MLRYGIAPSLLGQLTFSGGSAGTVPLTTKGGYVVLQSNDELFAAESADFDIELSQLVLALGDVSIADVPIRNGTIRLTKPVVLWRSAGVLIIPADTMEAELSMEIAGGIHHSRIVPTNNLYLFTGETSLSLSGNFGAAMPVSSKSIAVMTVSMTMTGSTSNPQAGCAEQTPQEVLLGFEDIELWRTSLPAKLSLSETLHTQGCFGLEVDGSGYMTIKGKPFATPVAGGTNKVALDVYIPNGQPNPWYLGAVQLYATCPSRNMNNAYIGQVELTGKPVGQFSKLTYTVPSWIAQVLNQASTDCYFSIAVNVNPTPTPMVLDNLRFEP